MVEHFHCNAENHCRRDLYSCHFVDEDTEVQRDQTPYPRSQHQWKTGGSSPDLLAPNSRLIHEDHSLMILTDSGTS